ncbi:hypothetical protein MACJ_001700 [Theileria orientalis]|uniref:Uncharacterized protein n=1 Tax=Theileria orientalis TaxID=68886 RepID=A0A976MBA3_THEOR|nr:hypothetical protein MACJ_001700 [Theileria orientalis]
MKVVTLYKVLVFWVIIGKNASVLCAGEAANETAKPAEGTVKSGGDNRKEIILDVAVKSCNQYSYTRCGDNEKFTVNLGFKIAQVVKGGVTVWTPKAAGKFGKEAIVNLKSNTIRVNYL